MITMFNRKELLITMSMEVQSKVREILSANGIDYFIKTKNLQASPWYSNNRGHTGTAFINADYSYEYKIYIRKEDYEKAIHLISNC